MHEGVRYSCHQCDSHFARKPSLKEHIETVHEGKPPRRSRIKSRAKEENTIKNLNYLFEAQEEGLTEVSITKNEKQKPNLPMS